MMILGSAPWLSHAACVVPSRGRQVAEPRSSDVDFVMDDGTGQWVIECDDATTVSDVVAVLASDDRLLQKHFVLTLEGTMVPMDSVVLHCGVDACWRVHLPFSEEVSVIESDGEAASPGIPMSPLKQPGSEPEVCFEPRLGTSGLGAQAGQAATPVVQLGPPVPAPAWHLAF